MSTDHSFPRRALACAVALCCAAAQAQNVTLAAYDPQVNDNQVGATIVASGATVNMSGPQMFMPGTDGSVSTSLASLRDAGRIISGSQWIGAARLSPGPQSFGVTIPDPITGGNRVVSTYNTANLVEQTPVDYNSTVPDVVLVNGGQYINMRVGTVTPGGGTMNVNIGAPASGPTAATNGWTINAKQTSMFYADGTGGSASAINWNSVNRITFGGTAATPNDADRLFAVTNVVTYLGTFNVTTVDGVTASHTVTNASQLQAYNNFLITQLQTGNLDPAQYNTEFNKAVSTATQNIDYGITATGSTDEVFQPVGLRVVMHAVGAQATGTVAPQGQLEVVNSNGGAMRAEQGGTITNNGSLSTTHSTGDGTAMLVTSGSHAANNGVLNSGVFRNGTAAPVGSAFSAFGVDLSGASDFTNTGVVNLALGTTNGAGAAVGVRLSGGSTASNSGTMNLGVTGSRSNGSLTGVRVDDAASSFTNQASGLIYLGRAPQFTAGAAAADIALNQQSLSTGITVNADAHVTNAGRIAIGTLTQNAAAMYVNGAANAVVHNDGVIDVNGKASTVPRLNVGMLVTNAGAGAGGDIANTTTGTINLNGVNGIGVQVLSTGASSSSAASAGTINVAGGADPGSGTRNYGVWTEGQGSGTSTANVAGAVNLLGTGAIGIHARGRATVNVAATSVPTFAGTDEIGFFAYGPNARINVAPGALLDVTTTRSNLFRLENGATFDGTGLSLRASGANSIAVLGTGASGTAVNTRDATVNVDGAGATGVLVEGGATGTIDAATTMNLAGTGAVAAIVDGQKHDLFGKNSGAPVASTTLTTLAALNSGAGNLTGYIARNSGKLVNSGNIAFTGAGSTGILVQTGATATNSGNISVTDGGTAIRADATGATAATTANTTGQLTIAGGSTGARTRGAVAQGARAVVNLNAGSTLQMTGQGAIGAQAAGGTVNVAAGVVPSFGNTDQIAFHGTGAGSKINSALTTLNATTDRSIIYRLDDGAALTTTGASTLTASGAGSRALLASGAGTNVNLANAAISVTGNNAAAVESRGGAAATLGAASSVNLTGPAAVGGIVDGQKLDLTGAAVGAPVATTLTNQGSVTGSGAGVTGFIARNLGSLINTGTVDLAGAGATGVLVQAGGTLSNTGLVHVANGTGVRVEGAGTQNLTPGGRITADNGTAAVQLINGAQLTIGGGDTTITAGGTAHGILVDAGASSLVASGSTITTLGTGNGIENAAEIGAIRLDGVTFNVADGAGLRTATAIDPASTVTFNVTGSGVGYAYRRADGSPGSEDLDFRAGYVAQVSGAGGIGLQALTTGNVNTAATANVTNAAGGAALVAGTAASTTNTGTLTSLSTLAPVVDLTNGSGTAFTNTGTISARDATGIAIAGSAGKDTITLNGGSVRGDLATGAGGDNFAWTAGSLEGGLTMGAGPGNSALVQGVDLGTTYHLLSGSSNGNALTLSGIQARGGSFASDDLSRGVNFGSGWNTINFHDATAFTLTDGLRLAGSDVDATSTLFAGDNVHPVISSPTPGSATLSNAGTLDLTNGAGTPGNTLTVDGQYVSRGGSLMLGSTLNEGGLLSVQQTDRFLVNGNVSVPGGPTLIDVTPTMASTGALTDFNHNGAADSTEGISLVQVGGTSTADAFRLKTGYVAAGPWQYALYAFAPGAADAGQRVVAGATAGNRFWDYRLENLYVCQDDCTPVTPQNPQATPPPGAPANPVLPEVPPGTAVATPPSTPLADGCVTDGMDGCAPGRRAVTPQVPAYISTPTALLGFSYQTLDNLHKRLGEIRQAAQDAQGTGGEVFARYIGGDYRYNSDRSFNQYGYDFDLDTHAFQVGTNILDVDGDTGTLRAGVAYTHGTTRLDPHAVDGDSHGKFTTNTFAMYVTWEHANGFYVDAMASGDRHSGDISTPMRGADMAHVRANGWNGSVEAGYPWHLDSGYVIEPQLQLTRQHLQTDSLVDVDNTTVAWRDVDQVVGRAGVRVYRTWDNGDGRQRTPYVRLNYLQGWGDRPQVTVGAVGTTISQAFDGGRYGRALELGIGGTWAFNRTFSVYGEGDYQKELNDTGLRGWGLNLGVRMEF